jgi:acyl carrier protein
MPSGSAATMPPWCSRPYEPAVVRAEPRLFIVEAQGHDMTRQSQVSEKVTTALAEYLRRDPATIRLDYHLRDDLGLDSMAVIELVYLIEETFNLQIPDEDLAGLTSVQHVVKYIEGRLEPSHSSAKPVAQKTAGSKATSSKTAAPKAAASPHPSKSAKKRS